MNRSVCVLIALTMSVPSALLAAPKPLTYQEIKLMSRVGLTQEEIIADVRARKQIAPLTAEQEKELVAAGATPALLQVLKSPASVASPEAVAKAAELDKAQAAHVARTAAEDVERARLAALRPPTKAAGGAVESAVVFQQLKGDLVRMKGTALEKVDDGYLSRTKYYALYFSAHWCGPCRKFTPELVEYYNHAKPLYPDFEIIFISADRSAGAMETYMRDTKMPWPAVDFAKRQQKTELTKFCGDGIPSLIFIDGAGQVLSNGVKGGTNFGPKAVIADIATTLAASNKR